MKLIRQRNVAPIGLLQAPGVLRMSWRSDSVTLSQAPSQIVLGMFLAILKGGGGSVIPIYCIPEMFNLLMTVDLL